jgi:twinkle protein
MARIPDPSKPFVLGDSIGDILAEARIELGRRKLSPGRSVKTICPACGGGSTREDSLSVKLDDDGMGAIWHCFRGNCGGSKLVPGSGRIADNAPRRQRADDEAPRRRERPPVVKPALHAPVEQQRPPSLYEFFAKRAISAETVDAFSIYGVARRWPQLDERGAPLKDEKGELVWASKPTVVFPYAWRGEVVNRKFRSIDKQFQQDRDSLPTLFNGDAVTSLDEVIICEGEMDVLAGWEAGFRQVVSLPNGAPAALYDEADPRRAEDQRFAPLATCGDILAPLQRIILATDGDGPGGYLAEELARRLGRARCWRVTYPEGCKDLNDVLMYHGAEAVRTCIAGAAPLPLAGLWKPQQGALRAFLAAGGAPAGLTCGIHALDEVVRFPTGGGWLITVTGIPAHGKGTFLRCWLPYLIARHDIEVFWFSPEDGRAETLALDICAVLQGQPVQEAGTVMPERIMAEAEAWIGRNVTFICADDPNTDPTLDWMMSRVEEAKQRSGGRRKHYLLVIDPWNEVEFTMQRGETEGQFTGRWLRKLKAWGRAHGLSVLIAAHPTKLQKDPKTGRYPVADGYDISGSANWHNKTDLGVTIYRERDGEMQVHNWKPKFRAFGQRGGIARLRVDPRTGRLSSIMQQEDEVLAHRRGFP